MTENNVMLVANDLGYGFVKAKVDGQLVKMPSVIAEKQTFMNPNSDTLTDKYMENFMSKMDVSISSAAVRRSGRFLIGDAAASGSSRKQTFNIYNGSGKSDDDMAMILSLSLVAGMKVKEAYAKKQNIFEPLTANVIMTTALPISEGRNVEKRHAYEKLYTDRKHVVTFNNFGDPITVTINFEKVRCYLEGEVASVALVNAAEGLSGFDVLDGLKKAVAKDYEANYPERAAKYGVKEVLSAQNTLSIDIGEGTTDLVVATNGEANPEASDSVDLGFGTALEKTRQEARIKGLGNFKSRYELKKYLSRDLIGANKEKQDAIEAVLDENIVPLSEGIVDAVSNILTLVSNDLDVIYVYGGGSVPMAERSHLREQLVQLVDSMNATCSVIWIDKEFAQQMNEIGLEIALTVLAA